MKKLNVMSLFNGMSFGMMALETLGVEVGNYYSSEIDKYANQATDALFNKPLNFLRWGEKYHPKDFINDTGVLPTGELEYQFEDDYDRYTFNFLENPQITQVGDVTKWREWDVDWSSIDLLLAGFPCQAWSMAGKQKGDNDPRGALVHDLIDIWNHIKSLNPDMKFMFENVKMKKEFLDYINELFGVEPICINSALVSAQNRVRYYWTNIPGVEQPEDKGVTWGDVREHGVNEFYYTEKGLQWLARHSQRKNKTLNVWQSDEKAQMIEASHYKNYSSQRFFGVCDTPSDLECVGSMRGRRIGSGGKREDYNLDLKIEQYVEFKYDGKSNCISTVTKDNIVVPFTLPNRIPLDMFFFRYVTPTECMRLQTVPQRHITTLLNAGISNSQLYKLAGNGWTHDVIVHIFKGLTGQSS